MAQGFYEILGVEGTSKGEDIAKAIQLAIEYAPEPPFDAGRYRDAPPDRVERVRSTLNRP